MLFYALPQHCEFYKVVVNMMEEASGSGSTHGTVTALFSAFDGLELERIVGTARAQKMLKSHNSTFIFC